MIKNFNWFYFVSYDRNILQNKKLYKNHFYIFIDYSFNKLFGIDGKLKIFNKGNFNDFKGDIFLHKQIIMYDINI